MRSWQLDRRTVLAGAGAVGVTVAVAPMAFAQDVESLEPELAANREKAGRILAGIIGGRPPREGLIEATAPDIVENGGQVPVSFRVNCSMTGDDYPRTVHVIGMVNPLPEIARYHFTTACGEAEVAFRCRMRASSNLVFVADMADGTVGMTRRYVSVTVGACADEGVVSAQRGDRRRFKVPESAQRGEIIEVKSLADHVMETGRRRNIDTGEPIPRAMIERVEYRYNGSLVFSGDWLNGVSANPYLASKLRAGDSGRIEITWIETDGTQTSASAEIEVTDPADS